MKLQVSSKDLLKARQSAKRSRTSVACARCKVAKIKCTEYRPCKRCVKSRVVCDEGKPEVYERPHGPREIPIPCEPYTLLDLPDQSQPIFQETAPIHLHYGTVIDVNAIVRQSYSTPRITTFGDACRKTYPTASYSSSAVRPDAQKTRMDFPSELLTSANQPRAFGQLPALQYIEEIHASQHLRNLLSSRIGHFADGSSSSLWLPTQHPTSNPALLPVMQSTPSRASPAALIPPAAMALLSAWATPPPPTLAPLNHLLPAFALPPPPAYPLHP